MKTDELLQRWSNGSITADELRELTAKLAEPEHQSALLDDWLLESSLPDVLPGAAVAGLRESEMSRSEERMDSAQAKRWTGWLSWHPLTAAAAVLVLAVLVGTAVITGNAQASPAKLLQRALKAHAAALDRCYRVEVRFGAGAAEAGETRLWTRGDRFWVETRAGRKTTAWGRDARGRVWMAPSPEVGAFFEPEEVRAHLALSTGLRDLNLDAVLRSMLADFDLHREPGGAGGQLIHAELRAGHKNPRYRAALLEVDAESGVLRRLELTPLHDGQAAAAVTLTHLATSLHDEANYALAAHLSPEAVVYDRQNEPAKRDALFARLFRALVPPAEAKR